MPQTNLSGKKQAALAAGFDLSKNITCQVTESRHREIKAKGHMTNKKPGEYCLGVMRGEARESAAQRMVQDADERGIDSVVLIVQINTHKYMHNTNQYTQIHAQYMRLA